MTKRQKQNRNLLPDWCCIWLEETLFSSSWYFTVLWKEIIIKLGTNYFRCLIQLQSDKNGAGRRMLYLLYFQVI